MKATAIAPSNIAFIKYWGKKEETLKLPENGSISMNLSNMLTTTTVEFDEKYLEDEISINGQVLKESNGLAHIERIRKLAGVSLKAKIVTKNNFPIGTGLSSSASGFAALTVAASNAAPLQLSEKELSIIARQGSGSACRSIPTGFVEWLDGDASETSYARSIYPPDYWDIADVVAVVSTGKKEVATTEGMKLVGSSPFFQVRKNRMPDKIKLCKDLLAKKDFTKFGELVEAEALEMHAVMLTSTPPLIYWTTGTLEIMKLTQKWRRAGLEVYFTINTGQDMHLIVQEKDVERLQKELEKIEHVKDVIVNKPAEGVRIVSEHLF